MDKGYIGPESDTPNLRKITEKKGTVLSVFLWKIKKAMVYS